MSSDKITEVSVAVSYSPNKQKFLILKKDLSADENPGKWQFPRKEIETNEPAKSALRQVEKDTGIKPELIRTGEPFELEKRKEKLRFHPFLVLVDGEPDLSEEYIKNAWIDARELRTYETADGIEKSLRKTGVDFEQRRR